MQNTDHMTPEERRKEFKRYWKQVLNSPGAKFIPEFLFTMRCGAKAKGTGQPCKLKALANGRCKFHGGLSTGPKTVEGKRRCAMNGKGSSQHAAAASLVNPELETVATLDRGKDSRG